MRARVVSNSAFDAALLRTRHGARLPFYTEFAAEEHGEPSLKRDCGSGVFLYVIARARRSDIILPSAGARPWIPRSRRATTCTRGYAIEEIANLAAPIAKAKSRLEYAEPQLNRTAYLARSDFASQQALDQAENDLATARAEVAEAEANH